MTQCLCKITNSQGKVTVYRDLALAYAAIDRARARGGFHLVGVAGSRARHTNDDAALLFDWLEATRDLLAATEELLAIVSGACYRGADHMAADYARARRIPLIEFEAEWQRLGKSAGFARNQYIAHACDRLVALPSGGGGTEDTIAWAERLGRPVTLL